MFSQKKLKNHFRNFDNSFHLDTITLIWWNEIICIFFIFFLMLQTQNGLSSHGVTFTWCSIHIFRNKQKSPLFEETCCTEVSQKRGTYVWKGGYVCITWSYKIDFNANIITLKKHPILLLF